MRLNYTAEARLTVIEAAEWYQREESVERAVDFVELIDREITQITPAPPFRSAIYKADVRRHNVRVYPYGIYYRVADDLVTILAVRHHSREPVDWDEAGPR